LIGVMALFAISACMMMFGMTSICGALSIPLLDPHSIPMLDPHAIPMLDPHSIPMLDPHMISI
jgi:hypothetical protein